MSEPLKILIQGYKLQDFKHSSNKKFSKPLRENLSNEVFIINLDELDKFGRIITETLKKFASANLQGVDFRL